MSDLYQYQYAYRECIEAGLMPSLINVDRTDFVYLKDLRSNYFSPEENQGHSL